MQNQPSPFKKASFWQRLIAFLFDYLLIAIFDKLAGLIFGLSAPMEYWVFFGLFYTYNIFMDSYHQATLGKMILRLKIVKADGQNPDLKSSFYRNFGKIISALPLFYGFLRILVPHRQQTVHDELGKCFVIQNITSRKAVQKNND